MGQQFACIHKLEFGSAVRLPTVENKGGEGYLLRTTSPQFFFIFQALNIQKNLGWRFGLTAFFSKIGRECWKIIIFGKN